MSKQSAEQIRDSVRKNYGAAAERGNAGGGCAPASACCTGEPTPVEVGAGRMGYSQAELESVPVGANLGLGCGNPQAIAALKPGDTVLDLGSGAGFDCFLAAVQVAPEGRVIGVDMTPQMLVKARGNAVKGGYTNVEFRQGEIERLPVRDESVDVIISNCVINLSPDKAAVFREAFRVLKPGGRLAVSDIVATAPLPEHVQADLNLYVGCVAGAETPHKLEGYLRDAGFSAIAIRPKDESREFIKEWSPQSEVGDYVRSATIEAVKPA